jgi:hypothetical protein
MARSSRLVTLLGGLLIATGVMCAAASARDYDGSLYLQPKDRTSLHFGVQLRHGEPYSFNKMRSGPIPLACDQGEDSVRLNLDFPRHVPHPLIKNGRFRMQINDVSDGSSFNLWGVIHRRHAHGGLSYRRDDKAHGHCSTDGRLVWLLHHR